jgi:hypothetical protein
MPTITMLGTDFPGPHHGTDFVVSRSFSRFPSFLSTRELGMEMSHFRQHAVSSCVIWVLIDCLAYTSVDSVAGKSVLIICGGNMGYRERV